MTAQKTALRSLAVATAAALLLSAGEARAQACANPAARDLLGASFLDTALNPPVGEDLEFLYKDAGFPNIMVLFDSSGSMQLLPPDGPGRIGGTAPSLPPGFLLTNRTNGTQQTNAAAAPRVVGCGIDPISAATPGFMTSDTFMGVSQRRFYPPCGTAVNPALVGATYQGHGTDYAQQMTVCPYFTSSNNQATGAPGYDPDFFGGSSTATTSGGNPVFFGRDLVFHDSALAGTYAWSNSLAFNHDFGDGWTDTAVYPWKNATNSNGSIAQFCNRQGATLQGALTRESICNTCLQTAGWYYDGILIDEGGYGGRYPSLWYTGNYLTFFPPKFLAARKVVKDIIAVQSRIRMAMTKFDSTGATLLRDFNPSCGMPDNSNFDSNRAAYVSTLNSSTNLDFGGGTPLAHALFNIGQYYRSPANTWFGASHTKTGMTSASNANQLSVCFACQVSTVIVLTDGVPNLNDGNTLPAGTVTPAQVNGGYAGDPATGIRGINLAAGCKHCNDFSGAQDYLNNLPRVAWYLANLDLRRNNETTLDCKSMGGKQTLQTYTVGFATGQLPNANTVLRNTALAGNGLFVGAEDPSALKDGINYILQEISNRSTSFSVATISTLQTTSGRAVIVPRFDPNKTAHWRGHLFRFDLYSEFVNSCIPDGPGDYDCDGKCVSTFLVDDTGSTASVRFVSEDPATGVFVQNDPPNAPLCDQAPLCAAKGRPCAVPGNVLAVPFWNAGYELSRSDKPDSTWKGRTVWTVTDTNGDGRIDGSDGMVRLATSTDTAANAIVPYLALGTSATGQSVCGDLANLLTGAGDFVRAAAVAAPGAAGKVECAKTLIRYLLGADVLNSLGKQAPDWPRANPEDLPDREYKLGDIFHSSPVVVDPPLPRDGILCPGGFSNQCISSLWGTATLDGEAAYDAYSKSTHYQNRRKIILVGANDGLLHAFNGGEWKANQDDPFTDAVKENLPPFNGHYSRACNSAGPGCSDGDRAKELWAFLPPDLISKLPLLMESRHQYFVDGTAMVRDVWVDGTSNKVGSGNVNDRKEGGEFHTLAIVGERRGGTRYFALDVTDATEVGTQPAFRWIYPQPGDRRSLEFGATYDDYLPIGPPIGPVRIEAGVGASAAAFPGVTPEMAVAGVAAPVKYREKWVAFLSGGYDPQYIRGRGVYMVDVWTGQEVFDFAYPRNPASVPAGDPRLQLRYPVAATVGMVPWGLNAKRASGETNGRFFDTATFGDMGGQLWAIRFATPAKLDTNGKATNWFGARIFQMGGVGACKLCGNQPFFYITANMPLATNMAYRVFAGTGDRANLLDRNGGTCGPDNIRACVLRGCTVTMNAADNFLASKGAGSAASALSHSACSAGTIVNGQTDGAVAACTVGGRARVQVTGCPGGLSTTSDFELLCSDRADGYRCVQVRELPGAKLAISDATNPVNIGNWYMSLLVFEESGARVIFNTLDEARTYDAARLQITQTNATTRSATPGIVLMAARNDNPATLATADSKGWAIFYDHGPTATIDNHLFNVAWQDERTSSGTAAGADLITWNTTQPSQGEVQAATTGGCRTSKCTAEARRVSYHYAAEPETGAPYFRDSSGNPYRSVASYLLVPTQADQTTVFVNQKGQVAVGLTAVNPEKGATNVGMSDPVDPTADVGVIEVSEELHLCRHAASNPVCK